MKRAIVIPAAAFLGIIFADSIPSDPHLALPLRAVWFLSLAWIGFRASLGALRPAN